ncbi:anthranilate synthase component I [Thermoanaerobacter italicus Ab9]|uniref:Anthranilate synthase component 1 n=1 Tax=Thermoanaerobacter italicus (strain DSM 9252 / Ab9) TaxID=580331 RepID=D3T384_THEIA|nr:anthranilate synthase component I [Thermoanaerobacter italicus]ADD02686.1 anthranilate synthase component I [Thermoanaerobacter italicus Ab9]
MVNISKEDFCEHKKRGYVFPVYVEINGDELTPINIFYSLEGKNKFLLESANGGTNWGRYSFIGKDPYLLILSYNRDIKIITDKEEHKKGMVLEEIKNVLQLNYNPLGLDIPFVGGAVGYVSYDTIRLYERLPDKNPDEINIPDVYFMFYKSFICYDHFKHRIYIVYNVYPDEDVEYEEVLQEINGLLQEIKSTNKEFHDLSPQEEKEVNYNFTKKEFCQIVKKAKEYIEKGDIFQVVLSQRLKARVNSHPFEVYRRLRSKNPSPYLFYIDFGDFQLLGSSPESLVSVFGDKVTTNPIAGTRRRGKDEEEDLRLKEELLKDEKERAEHVMLVDLGRNDIGKVSEFGSVKIERFMEVDFYSHVMHIVSTVSGKLKRGLTAFDALIACLPAGTVSGAPKIRAMEIIDELENVRRSFYAGAVGYFSYNGNMDMCIAIRTILFKEGYAYVQAGAGIVYDSIPEIEYYETLNKAMALKEVL